MQYQTIAVTTGSSTELKLLTLYTSLVHKCPATAEETWPTLNNTEQEKALKWRHPLDGKSIVDLARESEASPLFITQLSSCLQKHTDRDDN